MRFAQRLLLAIIFRAFGAGSRYANHPKMLSPDEYKYFSFQLWREGITRHTEDRVAHGGRVKESTKVAQRNLKIVMWVLTSGILYPMKCFQFLAAGALACLFSLSVSAQQPVVVQPGAPGQPTRKLPSSTRATLPPSSPADVQFMQGMIMHHAQAVEMTALIESHTENKKLRSLGVRINSSQSDEIKSMKRWLAARGHPVAPETHGAHMPGHQMLMPGMLTAKQMEELKHAKGEEFDRLFLEGMIKHHKGALVMVKELFDAGGGQDAELFNFATDVDNGQRAEIKVMESMLGEKP